MTFDEMQEAFWDVDARFQATLWKTAHVVSVDQKHTIYLRTSKGPSSCISDELRDWLKARGLQYGNVTPGFWTETWPQLDDEDNRNLVYFNVHDHEIALLFKLTFGGV